MLSRASSELGVIAEVVLYVTRQESETLLLAFHCHSPSSPTQEGQAGG